MSQDSEYPEHAPESFYDRLADAPFSPEDIPDDDAEVQAQAIYRRVRKMSPDERREISGSAGISSAAEKLVHEEVYGTGFRGPITVDFKKKRHGRGISELRLSVSNSPHGGLGEDAHRAFRSFPFEAGAYREKYAEMLQEYDDNRKSERKIQETKNRVQNRIKAMEGRIFQHAKDHPGLDEKVADWADTHGEISRIQLTEGAKLSKITPSKRGNGVDLHAKRLDPELAFLVLSVLQAGTGEMSKLLKRLDRTLNDTGATGLRSKLFNTLDTGTDLW